MEPTENTPQENVEVSSDAQATSDLQAPQHVEHPQGEEIVKQASSIAPHPHTSTSILLLTG